MRTRTTMTLVGFGTVSLFGAYLYRKPALRKRLWSAHSLRRAVLLLGREIRHDATDTSISFASGAFSTMARNLRKVQNTLRRRFVRSGRATLNKAEDVSDMMLEGAERLEEAAASKRMSLSKAAH